MNRLFTCPQNLVHSILYKIIPVPEAVPLYYRYPANSHWTITMHNSSSGQLNKLYDPHFRTELWKEPCINNTKYFFLYVMASYFCSSNYNRLVLVMSLLSSENL